MASEACYKKKKQHHPAPKDPRVVKEQRHRSKIPSQATPTQPSRRLILRPMPHLPHLLKPRLPQHLPPCALLPPKAAEQPHKATPLPRRQPVQQPVVRGEVRRRGRGAERDGRVDEDERRGAAVGPGVGLLGCEGGGGGGGRGWGGFGRWEGCVQWGERGAGRSWGCWEAGWSRWRGWLHFGVVFGSRGDGVGGCRTGEVLEDSRRSMKLGGWRTGGVWEDSR